MMRLLITTTIFGTVFIVKRYDLIFQVISPFWLIFVVFDFSQNVNSFLLLYRELWRGIGERNFETFFLPVLITVKMNILIRADTFHCYNSHSTK